MREKENMSKELCSHPGCFVCGDPESSPSGLHLSIFWDPLQGYSFADFTPSPFWNGFQGMTHGGIITSLLDDLMAWAIRKHTGYWAATGSINVQFRRPVEIGKSYRGYGNLIKGGTRKAETQGRIEDTQGNLCVEGKALFFYIPLNLKNPKEDATL